MLIFDPYPFQRPEIYRKSREKLRTFSATAIIYIMYIDIILKMLLACLLIVVIAVILARLITKAMGNSISVSKYSAEQDVGRGYERKQFLSQSEQHFLKILQTLEPQGFHIVPQIHLASVIRGDNTLKTQNELDQYVSLGVFDQDYTLLLLVQVSRSPYKNAATQKQTEKLKAICSQVGLRLVTFYTDKPNAKDYILDQVQSNLKPPIQPI